MGPAHLIAEPVPEERVIGPHVITQDQEYSEEDYSGDGK
jgi:hypothetical protein